MEFKSLKSIKIIREKKEKEKKEKEKNYILFLKNWTKLFLKKYM